MSIEDFIAHQIRYRYPNMEWKTNLVHGNIILGQLTQYHIITI